MAAAKCAYRVRREGKDLRDRRRRRGRVPLWININHQEPLIRRIPCLLASPRGARCPTRTVNGSSTLRSPCRESSMPTIWLIRTRGRPLDRLLRGRRGRQCSESRHLSERSGDRLARRAAPCSGVRDDLSGDPSRVGRPTQYAIGRAVPVGYVGPRPRVAVRKNAACWPPPLQRSRPKRYERPVTAPGSAGALSRVKGISPDPLARRVLGTTSTRAGEASPSRRASSRSMARVPIS